MGTAAWHWRAVNTAMGSGEPVSRFKWMRRFGRVGWGAVAIRRPPLLLGPQSGDSYDATPGNLPDYSAFLRCGPPIPPRRSRTPWRRDFPTGRTPGCTSSTRVLDLGVQAGGVWWVRQRRGPPEGRSERDRSGTECIDKIARAPGTRSRTLVPGGLAGCGFVAGGAANTDRVNSAERNGP